MHALDFYCNKLGLKEVRRRVDDKSRYTLVFLAAPEDESLVGGQRKRSGRDAPLVELTYNWDTEDYGEARYFGHLAYEVDDIYAALRAADEGGRHHQPAAARRAHGVRALARQALDRAACRRATRCRRKEPWTSMPNTGQVVRGAPFVARQPVADIALPNCGGSVTGSLPAPAKPLYVAPPPAPFV